MNEDQLEQSLVNVTIERFLGTFAWPLLARIGVHVSSGVPWQRGKRPSFLGTGLTSTLDGSSTTLRSARDSHQPRLATRMVNMAKPQPLSSPKSSRQLYALDLKKRILASLGQGNCQRFQSHSEIEHSPGPHHFFVLKIQSKKTAIITFAILCHFI